jgi:Uma2 family endonuclease
MLQASDTAEAFETCRAYPISIQLPTPLRDAELLWLSEHNAPLGFEQTAEGVLIVTPPTGSRGNRGELELITQLVIWNKRVTFGEIRGISGGVLLPKGGQYQADAFAIAAGIWSEVPMEARDDGYPPTLPTAAFELISPGNLTATGFTKEFEKKLADYERSAVPLVVLLQPKSESATIRRPGHADETTDAKVLVFPELSGLELDVSAIYAACNKP